MHDIDLISTETIVAMRDRPKRVVWEKRMKDAGAKAALKRKHRNAGKKAAATRKSRTHLNTQESKNGLPKVAINERKIIPDTQ
jgi:hypothetical protein